jgi:small subunit ribosomal protein S16
MVKIRLMRVGKVKQPSYRVVVADARSPRDGRIIEAIGQYNPRLEPSLVEIDGDRALHWLQRGAQPSSQVRKLLQITGVWSSFTGAPEPSRTQATSAPPVRATRAASVEDSPEAVPPADEPDPVAGADETPGAEAGEDEA